MLRRLAPHRLPRLLAPVALAVVAAAGCEARTTVDVDVREDGSGTVEVAVGLDADAMTRIPDLDDDGVSGPADLVALLRVEDMAAAGWDVGEPEAPAEGDEGAMTWVRATKPFGTPDEAVAVLSEVTGAEGALRDLSLDRSTGFGSTSFAFAGTVDLSGGLEAFGDAGLAGALDGEPLGEDAVAIEQRLGQPLADAFALDLTVALPGSVDAGTGEASGDGVTWSPRLGEGPAALEASSEQRDLAALGLAGVAAASGVALLVVLALRAVRRR
jgi:hypothetical protein